MKGNGLRSRRPDWRKYQSNLKRKSAKQSLSERFSGYFFGTVFFFVIVYGVIGGPGGAAYNYQEEIPADWFPNKDQSLRSDPQPSYQVIGKEDIRDLLDSGSFINLRNQTFDVVSEGQQMQVKTTLDVPLQRFLLDTVIPSPTSRYIGIVAMDPYTGKVLSMVSFDKNNAKNNACVDRQFPAASVFKIVTAAAAVEKCGLNSDSEISYSGRKHTLYKFQLKETPARKADTIALRDAFAQSVNPVFGKIGVHYLGKTVIEKYGEAFGFNRHILFEIPLCPSTLSISDEPYQWAEVASGFNRQTTISPVHGALMTSAILNQGRLMEPILVDQIKDKNGRLLYRSRLTVLNQAISPESSGVIKELMNATIASGTCRRFFKGYEKDPVLSRLLMGGKTGTICSENRNERYDWFVGFAEEKEGTEKLVISIVIAHEKHIGIKSSQYARMAIREYFGNCFEKHADNRQERLLTKDSY